MIEQADLKKMKRLVEQNSQLRKALASVNDFDEAARLLGDALATSGQHLESHEIRFMMIELLRQSKQLTPDELDAVNAGKWGNPGFGKAMDELWKRFFG
jgi:hypothetical protein